MLNFHYPATARQFMSKHIARRGSTAILLVMGTGMIIGGPAAANSVIANDLSRCSGDNGNAVLVTVQAIKTATGTIRIQSYPATEAAWLEKGQWLNRIEQRAKIGDMQFCLPIAKSGDYAIAVRHDKNNNGKTDLSGDGGGFSQNPKINAFRAILGKSVVPVKKAAFFAGSGVTRITILMRYR